ncbi:MAG: phytanoyl-CoA dioxygenase family protein [Kiloniellaceae bacterium]
MALACLAAEAEGAGEKLVRRGYALIDGSAVDLTAAVAAFDRLQGNSGEPLQVAPDHPLVAALLGQPAVRDLVAEAVGTPEAPGAKVVRGVAFDQQGHASWFVPWHQAGRDAEAAQRLILRWHLDLIGPADGGLRVLPGSHVKGRLSAEAIDRLAAETPSIELAVSAGTVLALRPLVVQGARRRTTRGHRRILQVELAPRG